jgi:hypothetical protein
LYYSGTKKIETTSGGVKIGDGSSAGYEIEYDTGVMYVTNTQHAGIVYHQVEDTNGDVRNMIGLNPNGTDTQVYLYAGTGVWVFKTVDNGTIGGFELGRSSTLAKLNVNSGTGDFKIQNVSDGGDIYITGEVATDTEKTMAKFAPHQTVPQSCIMPEPQSLQPLPQESASQTERQLPPQLGSQKMT